MPTIPCLLSKCNTPLKYLFKKNLSGVTQIGIRAQGLKQFYRPSIFTSQGEGQGLAFLLKPKNP